MGRRSLGAEAGRDPTHDELCWHWPVDARIGGPAAVVAEDEDTAGRNCPEPMRTRARLGPFALGRPAACRRGGRVVNVWFLVDDSGDLQGIVAQRHLLSRQAHDALHRLDGRVAGIADDDDVASTQPGDPDRQYEHDVARLERGVHAASRYPPAHPVEYQQPDPKDGEPSQHWGPSPWPAPPMASNRDWQASGWAVFPARGLHYLETWGVVTVREDQMREEVHMLSRLANMVNPFRPLRTVHAHCDIPCGIYDPEQARIEAESCYGIIQKYHDSDDPVFRDRCMFVKEERAELAKNHVNVLWTDWYKPDKMGTEMHETFKRAVVCCSNVKRSMDLTEAQKLLEAIDEIDDFWKRNNGPSETRLHGRPG